METTLLLLVIIIPLTTIVSLGWGHLICRRCVRLHETITAFANVNLDHKNLVDSQLDLIQRQQQTLRQIADTNRQLADVFDEQSAQLKSINNLLLISQQSFTTIFTNLEELKKEIHEKDQTGSADAAAE